MIVYKKDTGQIVTVLGEYQTIEVYFQDWGKDYIDNLATLDEDVGDINKYKVVNGEVVEMTEEEKEEVRLFSEIFTEERRTLNKLIPSQEEIEKAKRTLEMIELIKEVLDE